MDGNPDIISQWRLTNDGADDLNQNNGTVTTDDPPGALVFDGDDYVEVPNFSYPSEFTLMFDFQVNDLDVGGEQSLFSQGEWKKPNYLSVWINDKDEDPPRSLVAQINDSTESGEGSPYFEFDVSSFENDGGAWHSFAIVVRQGVGHSIYIDGNLEFTSSRASGLFNPTGPAYFGAEEKDGSLDYHLENHDIKNARLYSGFDLPTVKANQLNEFDSGSVSITVRNEETLVNNNNIEVDEDQTIPITNADLLTTDIEDGASALRYEISVDASYGKLVLNGVDLHAGDSFTQKDIDDGSLEFRHNGNETATADSITMQVDDGAGTATTFALSITIKLENDLPELSSIESGTLNYIEGDGAVVVSNTIAVSDADNVELTSARVEFIAGYESAEDELLFIDTASISGSFNSTLGILTLTGTGNLSAWQDALRSIQYRNSSESPEDGTRTLSFTVNDGTADSLNADRVIQVFAVNDAPDMGNASLAAVAEDTPDPDGDTVGNLFNSVYTDVDGTFSGVAIASDTTTTEGVWQYSTPPGVTWHDVGSVSTNAALLIEHTAMLRFVPSADFFGVVPDLTVYAIDDSYSGPYTSDTSRALADVTTRGGAKPFADGASSLGSYISAVGPADLSSGIEINNDGGNDTYLLVGDGSGLLGGLTEVTVEAQFESPLSNDRSTLFSYNLASGDTLKLLVRSTGQVDVGIFGTDVLSVAVPELLDGNRHSVAVSWDSDGGQLRMYADGELVYSVAGFHAGQTLPSGGALLLGLEQDSLEGGFEANEVFSGTLHDIRVWDEVRTPAEIQAHHDQKLYVDSLPSTLIANWQMDGINTAGEVIDVVSGNNLSIKHTGEAGFSDSVAATRFQIPEGAPGGTSVGTLETSFPYTGDDLIQDGSFTVSGDTANTVYSAGTTIGGVNGFWQVDSGDVDLKATWDDSPLGGVAVDLSGDSAGTISQTFSTIAGQEYQLTFALSGNFILATQQSVRISTDGNDTNLTVNKPDRWDTDELIWENRSIKFIASSDTTTISFQSLNTGNQGPLISDVQVLPYDTRIDTILADNPGLVYDGGTGKFYLPDATPGAWITAQNNANSTELNGVKGRLVTILSDYENRLARILGDAMGDNFHLGASDQTDEGVWRWQTASGDGELLWTGQALGAAPHGTYTNWKTLEPNNTWGDENHLVMFKDLGNGTWNDARPFENYASIIEWDVAEVLSGLTYSIVSDPESAFSIDNRTGHIMVVDISGIDNEADPNYQIRVRVTDAVGEYYEEDITIFIVDNTAPQLSSIETTTLSYTENDAALTVTSNLVVSDLDNTELDSATASIVGYAAGEDLLRFTNYNSFTHTWNSVTGSLTISSTSSESLAEWQNALRTVTYENSSDDPSAGIVDIDFVVSDGAESSNTVTRSVLVNAVNDAPTLGNGALVSVEQNNNDHFGQTVGDIFGSAFLDVDGIFAGVAVVSDATVSEGVWEFSTDAGAIWNGVGIVSDGAALMLDTSARLRFVPATDYHGIVPALSVVGVDDSYAGDFTLITKETTDVSTRGSATPFATASSLIQSYVLPVGPIDLSSGIELNTDGGNDAYLISDDGGGLLGGLSAFTVEALVTLDDMTGGSPLVSYATLSSSNTLMLEVKGDGSLLGVVNGDLIRTPDGLYPREEQPHSVAFSWDSLHGEAALYIDGVLVHAESGIASGSVIASGGELVFGQEQDAVDGGYDLNQVFEGTYHDIRLWNEARTAAELSQTYLNKFQTESPPASLIANWQMDGFDAAGDLVDVISGNTLSVKHVTDTGFSTSVPEDRLTVDEYAVNGTVAGTLIPHTGMLVNDIVQDGLFTWSGSTGVDTYGAGNTIGAGGPWLVESGNVNIEGARTSPLGGKALDLNGSTAGEISQTLTTEPGAMYQVLFALTGNFDGVSDKTLTVSTDDGVIGNSTIFTVEPVDGWTSPDDLMWNHRSFTFTAGSSATKLSFSSVSPVDAYGAVISDVQVVKVPSAVAELLASDSDLKYNAGTGKFYKNITTPETFSDARDAAVATELNGVSGQLVTINSVYENDVVLGIAQSMASDVWLGASDEVTEGDWHWLDGTQQERHFWTGLAAGSRVDGAYTNWGGLEPDDPGGSQNYAAMTHSAGASTGVWYDDIDASTHSYVIEWDADAVFSAFTYDVTTDPSGAFAIDNSSGAISVVNGSLLDHEVAASHDITVRVTDAAGMSYDETVTIFVNDVSAPVLTHIDSARPLFTENGAPLTISNSISVLDADDTHLQSATVAISSGYEFGEDVLLFSNTGTLSGVWDANTAELAITGTDTVAAWQSALRSVTYQNISEDPVEGVRDIEFVIRDDNEWSGTIKQSVSVIAVNDEPTIANHTLNNFPEDSPSLTGTSVGDILSAAAGDLDGSLYGVAVTADATTSEGQWQYSTDNGANWYSRGSISEVNALVLDNNARLRFFPTSDYNGPVPGLTVYAIDDTYSAGSTVGSARITTDVTIPGSSTPFSATAAVLDGNVIPVNDAPHIADAYLSAIAEDTASSTGDSVGNLFAGGLTDIDGNEHAIAVANDATSTEGQWQYSTDSGSSWRNVGAVTESGALVLDLSTRMRFVPSADFYGPAPNLTVYGVDSDLGTGATNDSFRVLADVTTRGGSTSFSADPALLATSVIAVNDSPTISDGVLADATEDSTAHIGQPVSVVFSGAFDDIDGTVVGIAVAEDATLTEGQWQYSTDLGAAWYSVGTVDEFQALVLGVDSHLRFLPALDYTGPVPQLTIYATDDSHSDGLTSGATRVEVDVIVRGGSTAFSATAAGISSDITPVNDAPTIADGTLINVDEDSTSHNGQLVSAIFNSLLQDVDGSVTGIAIAGDATTAQGQWEYSTDGGASWFVTGSVSESLALVLDTATHLRFVPVENYNGPVPSLTVYAVDNTHAAGFTTGVARIFSDVTSRGASTAVSAGAANIVSAINPVNDAPEITDGALTDIPEDSVAPPGQVVGDIFNGVLSDIEGTATGIAIGGDATVTEGVWEYSTDSATWYAVGLVTETAALLLDVTAELRFVPSANYAGVVPSLDVYGVDATHAAGYTAGAARVETDVSIRGGITSYSAGSAGIVSVITPINDAPALSDGVLSDVIEDSTGHAGQPVGVIFNSVLVDVDGTVTGIAIADDSTNTEGLWEYSTDNGTNWFSIGSVSDSTSLLLDTSAHLRFVPSVNFNGLVPSLTVFAVDDSYADGFTTDAVRKETDVSARGGSTPVSASAAGIISNILPVNDAPTIMNGVVDDISEDSSTHSGTMVSDIFSGVLLDIDGTANKVAIANDATGSEGQWQYSTDVGGSWFAVGSVEQTNALVIDAAAHLRFLPATDFNGLAPELTAFAIDDTWGGGVSVDSSRVFADVSVRGDDTSFSAAGGQISNVVTPVNDAPTLGNGVLTDIAEDSNAHNGDVVSAIFGASLSDVDGSVVAIAIGNDTTTTQGQWQYRTDTGSGWLAIGAVSNSNALVIDVDTSLRFLPAADYNGSVPVIEVYAVDNSYSGGLTAGTLRSVADVTVRGGTTPYALDYSEIAGSVTPVFDPPVNTGSLPGVATVIEDTSSAIDLSSVIFDAADYTGDLTLQLASTTGGILSGRSDASVTVGAAGTSLLVSGNVASLNSYLDTSAISYLSGTEHVNGTDADTIIATLHYGASNTVPLGSMNVNITPVNDPPQVADSRFAAVEDTPVSLFPAAFSFSDPHDGNNLQSVKFVSVPTNGSLTFNNFPVVNGDTLTVTQIGTGNLVFEPEQHAHGVDYDSLRYQVVDDGGELHGGVDTSSVASITFDVSGTNDPPSLMVSPMTILRGESHTFDVTDITATDEDVDNAQRIITVTSEPVRGSLLLGGSVIGTGSTFSQLQVNAGELSYQHDGLNSDNDAIALRFNDSGPDATAVSINRILTIAVTETHPQAVADTATVVEDGTVAIVVLDNDMAADEPLVPSTVTVVDAPLYGTALVSAAGEIQYAHNGSEVSTDLLTYTVADSGGDVSDSITVSVTVLPVNDNPEVTGFNGPASQTNEDTTIEITVAQLVSQVANSDAEDGFVTAFQVTGLVSGTLALGPDQNSTIDYVPGSIAEINSAVNAYWTPDTDAVGIQKAFSLRGIDSDNALSAGSTIVDVEVLPINDPPALSGLPVTDIAYIHRSPAIPLAPLLELADRDSSQLSQATVQLVNYAPGVDILSVSPPASLTSDWNPITGMLTLSGNADNYTYRDALRTVSYQSENSPQASADPIRQVEFLVMDDFNDTSVAEQVTVNLDVPVYPVVLTTPDISTRVYVENSQPLELVPGLLVESVDGRNITSASVTVDGYHIGEDQLSIAASSLISSSWDVSDGVLTLTGDAQASVWEDVLRSIRYVNSSDNPSTDDRIVSISLLSSSGESNDFAMPLEVVARNDAPVAVDGSVTISSGAPYVFKLADFGFSDPVEGDELLAIRFETLPVDGQVVYNETAVSSGHEVLADEIVDGVLRYVPVPQTDSSVQREIEYRVRDAGGVQSGGSDLSQNTGTLDLVILPIEEPTNPGSNSVLPFQVAENSPPGTLVGALSELEIPLEFSRLSDGDFAAAANPLPDFNRYTASGLDFGSTLGDWTVASGSIDLRGSSWGNGPDGGVAVDMNGGSQGIITQQISTVPGAEYELSFVLSGNFLLYPPDGKVRMEVEAGDERLEVEFEYFPDWSRTNLQWQAHTLAFTATNAITSISFKSLTPGQVGAVITDVEVVDVLDYQLLGNSTPFEIDSFNKIVIVEEPDFETQSSYAVDVIVSNSVGDQVVIAVPVEITDLNESPVLAVNNKLETILGLQSTVDNVHLAANDPDASDSTSDAQSYTITHAPDSGELRLNGSVLVEGEIFSQEDIDLGRVSYLPYSSTAPQDHFGFSLSDGGEDGASPITGDFNIDIRDPLSFEVADDWLLLEGGQLVLSDAQVLRDGGYLQNSDLLIVLSELAEQFSVVDERTNLSITEFSLSDLADGNILLVHDGSEVHEGEMVLSIYDTSSTAPVLFSNYNVNLSVADVADAPLGANSFMATDHLTPLAITVEQLAFHDADDGDELLGIKITELPDLGTVQLSGAQVSPGDFVGKQIIDMGQLQYVPDPTTSGLLTEIIRFHVVDSGSADNNGANQSEEAYVIEIAVQSDHSPQAHKDKVIVGEGGVISSLSSNATSITANDTDHDTPVSQLLVELVGAPIHGALQLNTDGTFTYTHDGGETRSDSFTYRVVDSQSELNTLLGSIGMVEIEITPRNDQPSAGEVEDLQAVANQPLELALPADLFTDVDADDELTYTATLANGLPLPLWLDFDPVTGEFSGTPDVTAVGTIQVLITATDSAGAIAQSDFEIAIEPQFDAALPDQIVLDLNSPDPIPFISTTNTNTSNGVEDNLVSTTATDTTIPENNTETPTDPFLFAVDGSAEAVYLQSFEDTVIKHGRQRSVITGFAEQEIESVLAQSDAVIQLQQLFYMATDNPSGMAKSVQQEMNKIRDDVATNVQRNELVIGGAISLSAGFSIGYIIWLIRGGLLLSSVLASMPAWRLIDPVPVLEERDDANDSDDAESLQSMVEDKQTDKVPAVDNSAADDQDNR